MLLVLAVVAGCGGSSTPTGPAVSGLQSFSGLTHAHVTGHVTYPQVPPVGGDHNARWQRCAAYTEPVPNETAVHSMEHGAIWITYRPGLAKADVATLAALTSRNEEFVLVSPYPGLPSPVVVSTWGYQLRVDSADDPRIAQVIEALAGGDQGGEKGAPCRTGGLTLEQAQALLGS